MQRRFLFLVFTCCAVVLTMLSSSIVFCQIPLDTSYTVESTYRKLVKQYPDIRPAQARASNDVEIFKDVVYRTIADSPFGKRDLHADIFIPKGNQKKYPAIIVVHGGGWRAGNKSLNTPMAIDLAMREFVVVSIEYRLSLEAKYPAAVKDVKAAIQWVRENAKKYNIDESKIALAGYSAGGQLASLVGVTSGKKVFEEKMDSKVSTHIQAVIDLDGLLDFTHPETLAVKRNATSADISWLGGSYEQIPERWKEASPFVWVSREAPPFLFINSSQSRFHAGCDEMVKRLRDNGVYAEVHSLDDAPHSYWFFHPWYDPMISHMEKFLNKVFNPKQQ